MRDGWINRFFQRGVSNIRISLSEQNAESRFSICGDLEVRNQREPFTVCVEGFCLTTAMLEFQTALNRIKTNFPMVILE